MPASLLTSRPSLAIVGSGLSCAMMAPLLRESFHVTIFERAGEEGSKPADFTFSGNPIGLSPAFYYGLGGSTNLWTGGLMEMLPGEFTPAWPAPVRDALPAHYLDVVRRIYGGEAAVTWSARRPARIAREAHLTDIYYPPNPFRARYSGLYEGCDIRFASHAVHVEEAGSGVWLTVEQGGALCRHRFDFVVIAAGGLNSPVLLQRSGLGGGHVGTGYSGHPMGFVAKLAGAGNRPLYDVLRARNSGANHAKALMKIQDQATGLWSAFYLRPAANLTFASDPYARSFKFMAQPGTVRRYLAALAHLGEREFLYQVLENRLNIRLPSPYAYVLVINEQEGEGQGRVSLRNDGGPHLHWEVSQATRDAIARNLDTLAEVLNADLHLPEGSFASRLYSGAHHSGTCRMAGDARHGVVDTDLRLHGAERIYVCDGSVLPTTGATNTGLTIGALAQRLAVHLKGALRPAMPRVAA